ncbi:radical SAM protein [Desulfitobacterium chlororespirans]|uniref:4Fe-4S single cluster domain-containing protein n=1 Tax=Desulfitobacterium chlororespirans DSM 11544 TaxID=1121395 RepID=A0A1M7TR43_9FIRM|nr:radical SAM protein [Desulfitobacterium chlororespirans]SHN73083.1 4Fe-4S single cluster domain-containing protein [Desulfitobacterium chlororespirans DSM 11544]
MERYVMHVTKACNMDCLYCYEEDKSSIYTWEEVREFIDALLKYRTSDEFGIEFLGGEPVLAWNLIRQSYEYLEANTKVNVSDYAITTNGTVLNDEIIDYLAKNKKLRWAASLDGHRHANQLRTIKNTHENSYDLVVENLKKLQENGIEPSVHMVTHPYNVAYISDSIQHLYNLGFRHIGLGTVEKTIQIDQEYCKRFIEELDLVSQKVINGTYLGLNIGQFNWLKPCDDVRTYIKDPVTGKIIGESYGRSGDDITYKQDYNVTRCEQRDDTWEMIHYIRKTVYDNHQKRLRGISA